MQWIWLFWASFGRMQKNISYLTDNIPKQGYKVLLFFLTPLQLCLKQLEKTYIRRGHFLRILSQCERVARESFCGPGHFEFLLPWSRLQGQLVNWETTTHIWIELILAPKKFTRKSPFQGGLWNTFTKEQILSNVVFQ